MSLTLDIVFETTPLIGTLGNLVGSIFLPRGGSEEKRQEALRRIKERQELIESTPGYNPLLVFSEGGTTNGTSILKFKKGGFAAEKRVRPIIQKYDTDGSVSIAYDIIEMLPLAILQLSWCGYRCKIYELPDFEPNEYLFEKHADKGQERWEIFAWAVREVMAKASGLELVDMPFR